MKNFNLSSYIKEYIRKSIIFVMFMVIGYSFTNFIGFTFAGIGYCVAGAICCIKYYRKEKIKEKCFDELIQKIENTNEKEVIENDV